MHINEQYHDLPLLETKAYQFIGRDGQNYSTEEQVLNEHLLDVYINDRLTMKLICLPQHLTELVLGRLLTEHIIRSVDDIEQIYICEYGKRAKVYLRPSQNKESGALGLPLWRPLSLLHRKPYPQRLFFLEPSTGSGYSDRMEA